MAFKNDKKETCCLLNGCEMSRQEKINLMIKNVTMVSFSFLALVLACNRLCNWHHGPRRNNAGYNNKAYQKSYDKRTQFIKQQIGMIKNVDSNGDWFITEEEYNANKGKNAIPFAQRDLNKDGKISKTEWLGTCKRR